MQPSWSSNSSADTNQGTSIKRISMGTSNVHQTVWKMIHKKNGQVASIKCFMYLNYTLIFQTYL